MEKSHNKVFTFSDPRQDRIYKKLLEIGAGPAAFFKDACQMFEGEPQLESSSHLIAHCLREIESSIRDVMLPLDYVPIKKSKQNQKDQILAILASYGINSEDEVSKLWLKIAGKQEEIALHHLAHRNSLDRPRQKDTIFDELWVGMQDLLDILLDRMEANYLGYINTLDELLAKTTIEPKSIKILKEKIPNSPVTYNYFFGKLRNPDWLTFLKDAGFFDSPPPAVEHPDGGISYPIWSQSEYLKKMTEIPERQQEILDICLDVQTNNMRVRNDLLEIALLLPAEMSVQIVKKIDEIDYFLSPENYGKLIVYFSSNGKIKEASALARKVLAFVPDPRKPMKISGDVWQYDPIPVIRDYDYEEIVEKRFPEFVDNAGIEALRVLFDQLESFHRMKYSGRKVIPEDDYSEIWCPAIEDHPQNYKNGVRDSLVIAMIDSSEKFITNNPDKNKELIEELESRKLTIFRRLKLHLLRMFPKNLEEKIAFELLNKFEFGDSLRVTHEYFLLAEKHSSLLSVDQQKTLLKLVEDGGEFDKDVFEKICKQKGIEPTDEVAKKHKMIWQSYHLIAFKNLNTDIKKFYENLVSEVGEPESPDSKIKTSYGSWELKSSISDEEFENKKPEEIINILRDFKPEKKQEQVLNKSREGTGRSLTEQIAENPEKWSSVMSLLSDLDPTFVRSILTGYREALKKGKRFAWEPIIELGIEIIKKPIEVKGRESSGFYGDDPNWNWCRHTLVELIDDGLSSSNYPLPVTLRKEIWFIIESLTRDPSPTKEEIAIFLENNEDPLTSAINTTRGDAVDAAIQYGIWLKSSVPQEEQKTWSVEKDAPELEKNFEEKLDISKEPFLGIRAVFGEKLGNIAWMDLECVKKIIPVLFPDDPEKKIYFNAAWDAFITFNPPYSDLFPLLLKEYKRALKEIGQRSNNNEHHLENPDEMLAQSLLQFYLRGQMELHTGLFNDFYDLAPIELKAAVINFIGRSFKNNSVADEVINRAIELVEYRLEVIKKSINPHEDIQEFEDFGWWISSECFDDKWKIDTLIEILRLGCDLDSGHLVIEKYVTIAGKYPLEIITSLELMVENDKKGWGLPARESELKKVIQQVLEGDNDAATVKANEFIQRLVAKGNPQYKDLLR